MTETIGKDGGPDVPAQHDGHGDSRVDPIGEALRATYRADNHETLGRDVTGLMLDLSRVPFEPHEFAMQAAAQPAVAVPRPGVWVRLGIALRRVRGKAG